MAVLTIRRTRRAWRPELALALAAIVLLATGPAFFAPTLGDGIPAFTLDICHPLQSVHSPAQVVLAAPASGWIDSTPPVRTRKQPRKHLLATRPGDAPETPPPKLAVKPSAQKV